MSELIANQANQSNIRKHLLATASVLVFTSCTAVSSVHADNAERPTVWVQLGGQMEFVQGASSPFVAPFMANQASANTFDPVSALDVQKAPRFSFGEEGKISIQPKDSDWTFSAALLYGRTSSKRYIHQQTNFPIPSTSPMFANQHYVGDASYAEFRERQTESHFVLDFQVGKDVGVGLFGSDSASVVSAGFRMARISSSAAANQRMRPDLIASNFVNVFKYKRFYHHYSLSGYSERSFRGMGPSVSWNGSAGVFGKKEAGQLGLDWSANAALLFGRQKMQAHHHTTGYHKSLLGNYQPIVFKSVYDRSANPARSRSVVVPNIGGSLAVAYRFEDAKLDIGYRADIYFHATDTGFDTRQTSNILFHGPFATLSIGLGG